MRSLWIQRVNAASKEHGVSARLLNVFYCLHWLLGLHVYLLLQVPYSQLINGLQQQNIQINRKVLSELAVQEPFSFKALVQQVRAMRGSASQAESTSKL
jgi:large subunit ribosomal protein L20